MTWLVIHRCIADSAVSPRHKRVVCRSQTLLERFKPAIREGEHILGSKYGGLLSNHSLLLNQKTSLQGAIVGMAQNYVGSNNINLLQLISLVTADTLDQVHLPCITQHMPDFCQSEHGCFTHIGSWMFVCG